MKISQQEKQNKIKKMKELKVCSGLGNRLLALTTALCLSPEKLSLVWGWQKYHCECFIEDVLDTSILPFKKICRHPGGKCVYLTHAEKETELPEFTMAGSMFVTPINRQGFAIKAYKYIRPSKQVLDHMRKIDYRSCLSVHVRCGDKLNACQTTMPLSSTIEKIKEICKSNVKCKYVLLCTDDNTGEVRSAVYNAIRCYKHVTLLPAVTQSVSRRNVVQAASEFFMMCRTKWFIGNPVSSFSRMILYIRQGHQLLKP